MAPDPAKGKTEMPKMFFRLTAKYNGKPIVDNYYNCDYSTAFDLLLADVDRWFADRFALTDWIAGTNRQFDPIVVDLYSFVRR